MKRPFCIYLLKMGTTEDNCFKPTSKMEIANDAEALPNGAKLYILDAAPKPVWWRDYFAIARPLSHASKGAIIILPLEERTCVLTFGHVAHHLRDAAYERDFGIRFSLNSLDPNKIKNTDTLKPSSAMRVRTQVSVNQNLSQFDFDRDTSIVKSLTGKTLEKYKDIVTAATGSSYLRVSSDVASEELADLCKDMISIYNRQDYKSQFPDILNISPISDPDVIKKLDDKLVLALKEDSNRIALTIPEIVDYREAVYVGFRGARGKYISDDVQIAQYIDYLKARNIKVPDIDVGMLEKHEIYLCDENGEPRGSSYSIYKALVFETSLEEDPAIYHLTEGGWFRVDADYIKQLSEYIDPIYQELDLPDYGSDSEGEYNKAVAVSEDDYICLDTKNISPKGQKQIEPCDLIRLKDGKIEFTHVKISTQSSTLSHLFNQGISSIDILRNEESSKNKLCELIAESVGDLSEEWKTALNAESYTVRYAIVTHKDPSKRSLNFPLFSRITLYRILKDLRNRGLERSWGFIADKSPIEGLKKIKK